MDPAYLDRLERLARLKADGTLSQAEFDAAKADLLNAEAAAPATPASPLPSAAPRPPEPPIDEAGLSPTWRFRFAFIDQHGLPNAKTYGPAYRRLPFGDKVKIASSPLAFLLGPFYFLFLGLWRPALSLFGLAILFILILDALQLPPAFDKLAVLGPAALYSATAIPLYYLRVREGLHSWNPFVWWRR